MKKIKIERIPKKILRDKILDLQIHENDYLIYLFVFGFILIFSIAISIIIYTMDFNYFYYLFPCLFFLFNIIFFIKMIRAKLNITLGILVLLFVLGIINYLLFNVFVFIISFLLVISILFCWISIDIRNEIINS